MAWISTALSGWIAEPSGAQDCRVHPCGVVPASTQPDVEQRNSCKLPTVGRRPEQNCLLILKIPIKGMRIRRSRRAAQAGWPGRPCVPPAATRRYCPPGRGGGGGSRACTERERQEQLWHHHRRRHQPRNSTHLVRIAADVVDLVEIRCAEVPASQYMILCFTS